MALSEQKVRPEYTQAVYMTANKEKLILLDVTSHHYSHLIGGRLAW
jgi:hypothetical protein